MINKYNPDVISLNETFLKPKIDLTIDGYNVIRSDRLHRIGGGAAICLKTNITCKEINLSSISEDDNACGALIESNNQALAMFSYTAPLTSP